MKSFKSYLTEAADYSVDVIHHHVDDAGQKTKKTYTYNVKNALTSKHAKRIAMQKHENAVKLGKGESYSTSSSDVRMKEEVEQVDERCWPGYKPAPGKKAYDKGSCVKEDIQLDEGEGIVTPKKTHFGEPPKGTYAYERKYGAYTAKGELRKKPNPNKPPVKEDVELEEDWQKVNKADRTDGLSQKAVNAYRRENPGSKLQTAVTEKNPKGKRAARRKSFCSRMSGMKKRLTNPENARDPDSPINKALRRWNC